MASDKTLGKIMTLGADQISSPAAQSAGDLILDVSDRNWRLYMARKADPAFAAYKKKVLDRDDWTCCYCGFRAEQYMEVINLNGNYVDMRLSNLKTVCPFCAQCKFVESIGQSDLDGGVLIYLPEMSQTQLNAMCHTLFALMACGSDQESQVKNIYRSFRLRAQVCEQLIGEGMSQPNVLGRLIIETGKNAKEQFSQAVWSDLRVLPVFSRFVHQVEAWSYAAFSAWFNSYH